MQVDTKESERLLGHPSVCVIHQQLNIGCEAPLGLESATRSRIAFTHHTSAVIVPATPYASVPRASMPAAREGRAYKPRVEPGRLITQ
jgi:hypothetical protein